MTRYSDLFGSDPVQITQPTIDLAERSNQRVKNPYDSQSRSDRLAKLRASTGASGSTTSASDQRVKNPYDTQSQADRQYRLTGFKVGDHGSAQTASNQRVNNPYRKEGSTTPKKDYTVPSPIGAAAEAKEDRRQELLTGNGSRSSQPPVSQPPVRQPVNPNVDPSPQPPIKQPDQIISPPTQDLSAFENRIAVLEGKQPSWQEGRVANLESRPGWDEGRIQGLENRPQGGGGGNWDEDRIIALENKPQGDTSKWDKRIEALEGKQPSWQEDRISELENKKDDTSWQDPLSQVQTTQAGYGAQLGNLQTGQAEGKTARAGLDTRLEDLENYYKKDPPPENSTGNRYEDKVAALVKAWDMTDKPTKWDPTDTKNFGGHVDGTGQDWADDLQGGYVQEIRALNREYNKPVHTANIKGREYKAYDPRAAGRLRYLDEHNIHEDQYLGSGTWKDQYGDDVHGRGKGEKDRYFASHSGLDRTSDEYKRRFRGAYANWSDKDLKANEHAMQILKEDGYGSGRDYSYYPDTIGT